MLSLRLESSGAGHAGSDPQRALRRRPDHRFARWGVAALEAGSGRRREDPPRGRADVAEVLRRMHQLLQAGEPFPEPGLGHAPLERAVGLAVEIAEYEGASGGYHRAERLGEPRTRALPIAVDRGGLA